MSEEAGQLPLPGSNHTAPPSSPARAISEKPAKLGGFHKIQSFIIYYPKYSVNFNWKSYIIWRTRKTSNLILRKTRKLKHNINQQNLININRTLHLRTEYILFWKTHGTYNKLDHSLVLNPTASLCRHQPPGAPGSQSGSLPSQPVSPHVTYFRWGCSNCQIPQSREEEKVMWTQISLPQSTKLHSL